MLFNSWTFWIFFAVVLPIYWLLPHRPQTIFLLIASYFFYAWWDWRFLPIIAISTLMDYTLGHVIYSTPIGSQRKFYVCISVIVNLALLGVFKYYNFFSREFSVLLTAIGIPVSLPVLNVILPVGISFYTFQSMSYVLDIARGVTKPAKNLWNFALYVAFFPHLVAGPIMRSGTKEHDPLGRGLLKQLEVPRIFRSNDFQEGLYHILLGLFKKIVIGDNLASLVNYTFSSGRNDLTGLECLVGIYAFAWQIYADFSGYSSIAQGLAKWMGVDLMLNFRTPYLAINPSDFWRRWHISLSTWLRDYLYIPLGGSRQGEAQTYQNLLTTMIIGGLWHGANWTFLLWGAFHGFLLCAYRLVGARKMPHTNLGFLSKMWRVVLTFHLICFGWLLFRAENMTQVMLFVKLIATNHTITPLVISILWLMVFYVLPLFIYEWWADSRNNLIVLLTEHWGFRSVVYSYFIIMLILFPPATAHEFIYFQF
ncbi:MAG: MBOAT family protein [Candidatus Schekmanbacteria bacterium]|nr:MBOAT family protein [Candidatus Schekmanbacteria bacterium]